MNVRYYELISLSLDRGPYDRMMAYGRRVGIATAELLRQAMAEYLERHDPEHEPRKEDKCKEGQGE